MRLHKPTVACILTLLAAGFSISASKDCRDNKEPAAHNDYTSFVDPFIGTGGHGHTFPGAVVPHSMIQPSPDTRINGWDACSGYHYSDSLINGFSQTHLSGTGCADYGDFLLMPTTGRQTIDPQTDTLQNRPFASRFSHKSEIAQPGYYAVDLDRYGIRTEITATSRAAIYRMTYPEDPNPGMILDLDYSIQNQTNTDMQVEIVGDSAIRAYKMTKYWAFDQQLSFYAEFSHPFKAEIVRDTISGINGNPLPRCKVLISFNPTKKGEHILVKTGISAVDTDGAKGNLMAEIPGWDFESVRTEARRKWNDWLSAIDIKTTDDNDRKVFYTALYHTAISPNIFTDADGRYLGMDRKPHKAQPGKTIYTVFSLWDTYRALHPLLTIINPRLNNDFINSLLQKYDEGGLLPMWELAGNYTATMTGYHAVSLMADALTKGIADFDQGKAYLAGCRSSICDTTGIQAPDLVKAALMPESKKYKNTLGYIPWDKEHESVAKGLEYAYDDWCISLLAEAAGDKEGAREYAGKSRSFRHYFDPATCFMRGKDADGRWHEPFNPRSSNHREDDYCEGTAWQWAWYVPHDVDTLIDMMGGPDRFISRLDSLFEADSSLEGDLVSADISGLIGQYAHGNEPSHHIIHLYNYAGRPDRTQELVDKVLREQYSARPDGLSGNEDCGQMSAWYILNSLGFYQVCPGRPVYSIGRPWFEEASVRLPNGKKISIKVKGFSKGNKYIRSVRLNGKELHKPFFTHSDIAGGAEFEYVMSDTPATTDLTSYVNPLMGTQSSFELSAGNTYPAVAVPWGMNFWTPQTGKMGDGWQYTYDAHKIRGLKQTHQPSPWINDYGQFSIMPVTGNLRFDEDSRASWFSHKAEISRPHYYSVYLADHDVLAEITPTERCASMRFTFPDNDSYIVIDAFDNDSEISIDPSLRRITGISRKNSGGVAPGFANYFVIEFDHDFDSADVFGKTLPSDSLKLIADEHTFTGFHSGAVVGFRTCRGQQICARVASSFISHEQALVNLRETDGKNFDKTMADARARWNDVLGRIRVEDADTDNLRTFYSCLYRSLLFPRKLHEVTADGRIIHYSPHNGKILPGYLYTDTGVWDTFRALFPLINLVYPSVSLEIQEGFLNAYRESGFFPEWSSPGHRDCMVGNNTASVLADAWLKGIRVSDPKTLWEGLMKSTSAVHPDVRSSGRLGHELYNRLGYVACDAGINESAARTLEYAYDDWCLLRLGEDLEKSTKELAPLARRAMNYRNLFDPSTSLMRGRNADGTFSSPFSPLKWGDAFTEGNSWHYTWSVFHDPQGLIDLMGGRDKFAAMLDSVFNVPPHFDDSYYGFPIHEIREMTVMNMGNYAHGNQPAQHILYLYDWAGQPWKTQYHARRVLDRMYSPSPDGYCGDEDNGQTSAWYVFSALGFYPVCPVAGQYAVGSPLFRKSVITFEDGNQMLIEAPDNSPSRPYIREMSVNGTPDDRNYIDYDTLRKGGHIRFQMSATPTNTRGISEISAPYSFSTDHKPGKKRKK